MKRIRSIDANVLTLGEEADLEAQSFSLAQMPTGNTNVQFSTKNAFLPNVCYNQCFLLIINLKINTMSKLNKEFDYKTYKFNTSIELNTKVEKRLNGKRSHTIITNCMGGNNYYQKDEIETYQIEEYVEKHKQLATDYIDKLTYKPQSFEEQLLSGLGFS